MIKVIDLFSGAGGLTYGFKNIIENNQFVESDEFEILCANEIDSNAARAFKLNFPNIPMLNCSISEINKTYLKKNKINYADVDLVIGGPPCQSFSTVGKRQYDERAIMYQEYRRVLSFVKPKVFLFENVTGLLTMKNDKKQPVLDDIKKSFKDFSDFSIDLSYEIHETVLNAKYFGVPQNRERVFLVGIRKDLNIKTDWCFPIMEENTVFITLGDAIGDLPILRNGEKKNIYESMPITDYQRLMRNGCNYLLNHANGMNGERLLEIMRNVIQGEGRDYINSLVDAGELDEQYYLTSGYSNTYGRLWWDRPCSTITNNLSSPSSLRCIHPLQDRALTSREGARVQSFPDTFQFVGNKANINSQIGNAVPPLLASTIANKLSDFFKNNF